MELYDLVSAMSAGAGNPNRSQNGQYYMTNIAHPIIAALKREYCESKKISMLYPMSDQERFEFELCLFQPSVRNKIVSYIKASGWFDEHQKGGDTDNANPEAAPRRAGA
jgi:hypothetical protein